MQCDADNTCHKDALSENLKRIASDKGFMISDNEGSGNCMFHALSEQLHLVKKKKISHKELRQKIVQYLKKNPKLVSLVICFLVVVQQMLTCGLTLFRLGFFGQSVTGGGGGGSSDPPSVSLEPIMRGS